MSKTQPNTSRSKRKPKLKTYQVYLTQTVLQRRGYEVQATSPEEAERIVRAYNVCGDDVEQEVEEVDWDDEPQDDWSDHEAEVSEV